MIDMYLLQVILAVFSIFAFAIAGGLLKKYDLEQGPWLLLSLTTLCLLLSNFLVLRGNFELAEKFMTGAFGILALIAVVKFWDIMQLTQ